MCMHLTCPLTDRSKGCATYLKCQYLPRYSVIAVASYRNFAQMCITKCFTATCAANLNRSTRVVRPFAMRLSAASFC